MKRNTEQVTYNVHWLQFTDQELEILWRIVNTVEWTTLPDNARTFAWSLGREIVDTKVSAEPYQDAQIFKTRDWDYDTQENETS